MPKFQVLGPEYVDYTTKKHYKRGDIIKTHMPLDKIHINSFKRVDVLPIPDADLIDVSIDDLVKERKKAKLKKAMADVTDATETGVTFHKGVGTDDGSELDARGTDVSEQFKLEDGFSVFQRGDKFHVYKGDSSKPVNEKGLKAEKVESTLKSYMED